MFISLFSLIYEFPKCDEEPDVDPPSPVILTPIKDDGSENSND